MFLEQKPKVKLCGYTSSLSLQWRTRQLHFKSTFMKEFNKWHKELAQIERDMLAFVLVNSWIPN
jgi:hypothetical protein